MRGLLKLIVLSICIVITLYLFVGCTEENVLFSGEENLTVSTNESKEKRYNQAIEYIFKNQYPQAMGVLMDLGSYKNSDHLLEQIRYLIEGTYIGNGIWAVGAITDEGKVKVAYDGEYANNYYITESWANIKSLSFRSGDSIEGLTIDGRIVTTNTVTKEELLNSKNVWTYAMADVVEAVSKWSDIKAFQGSYPLSVVGVTNEGFVYAAYAYEDGSVKLEGWENIVSVADGRSYVIGLKVDGTVKSKVYDYLGEIDTSEWTDIVAISAGNSIIGLKKDGTVLSTGANKFGEGNVSEWTDIIAISTRGSCTLGLKSDGTVIATGRNTFGQMDVEDWTDIVAIAAGEYFSIGLKSDGSLVLSGDSSLSGAKTPDVSKMTGLYVPKVIIDTVETSELEGVWIETEYEIYPTGTMSVKAKWFNTTDDEMMFGEPFTLEKKVNDDWEKVTKETVNMYFFHMIGYPLQSNQSRWHTYNLHFYTEGLTEGEYRINTDFSRMTLDGVDYGSGNYPRYPIYGYFSVRDDRHNSKE
ncbi:hypothetical protein EDC18_103315 [Natranaerovirga pectinivora]|uniref:Bacterial Ig-like domain-containing protein n=1 Tax=Natranaerovirga pectinivora TaxID=682400 RepID=A0A4R3MS26_9FIRM|nr:immunoglobulin-like domain-containing protein [Natranaerovirga pectinivora]TCT15607.1 hypothetical protein EDC18_103315 [Natranaerovirga pectinivora]